MANDRQKQDVKEQPKDAKPALKLIPKGEDKPVEVKTKQAEAQAVVPAIRRLVIQTDGTTFTVTEQSMGLLEIYTVLELLKAEVVAKLPNNQQPRAN